MSNTKDNARLLDPNRFRISQSNAIVPGGPQNNNPMNITSIGNQSGSLSGINQFPYGDSGLENDMRMGANILNPENVPNSGLQQNFPMGQRLNAQAPFGKQQQPDVAGQSKLPDWMESERLAETAQKYGLNVGPMGMIGMSGQPAPGAFPSAFRGSSGPPMMPGMQSAEQAAGGMSPQNSMNPMTPGSTPTKIKKKRA